MIMTTFLLNIPTNWSDPALYLMLLLISALGGLLALIFAYGLRSFIGSSKKKKTAPAEDVSIEHNFLYKHIALRIKVLDVIWQGEVYGWMTERFLLRYEGGLILGQGKSNFEALKKMIGKDITVRVSAIQSYDESSLKCVIGATAELKTWSENTVPGPGEVVAPKLVDAIPT